jgi:hypothetical protein
MPFALFVEVEIGLMRCIQYEALVLQWSPGMRGVPRHAPCLPPATCLPGCPLTTTGVEGDGSVLAIAEVMVCQVWESTRQNISIHGFHDGLAAALVWTWVLGPGPTCGACLQHGSLTRGRARELDQLPWRGRPACGCSLESSKSGAGVSKPHMPRGSETLYFHLGSSCDRISVQPRS